MAYWGLLVVAFAVMLVMNALTTFKEDDLAFTLIEGVWTPVRSFADLLQSHLTHYTGTNGRLADLVPELFAGLLGKTAFNVVNALVFVLMAHLVSLLATGRRSLLGLSSFLTVVGTCYPVPATMLWMAGSANYMWAITLSLALVLALKRAQGKPLGWGMALVWLLFGFVAGGFNEATSLGFLGGLMLFYAFNYRLFDRRVVVTLMGYALGIMLIVSSPGAWNRMATDIALDLRPDDLLSSRWHIFMEKMWRFYLPLLAAAVGVFLLLRRRDRAVVRQSVWTYVLVCSAAVMFALGLNHERAYAPLVTVAAIIVIQAVDFLLAGRWQRLRLLAVIALLGLCAFTYARGIVRLSQYKAYNEQVEREIAAAPGQAILRERQFDIYSRFIKPMNYMSTNYFAHEVIYRAYYGKENVQFVNDSVYHRYHEGRLLDGAQLWPMKAENPDITGDVLRIPGQDYIVVNLRLDTLPATPQTARYSFEKAETALSQEELQRRQDYGLTTAYEPKGFFPLEYQGKRYLILPVPDSTITQIEIPMDITPNPVTAILKL